ncbi:RNA polymerase sporulation sigma factor SigH [Eubacteriales bacterium OttesenSCG-928-N14]|nr:RNA polymerase sporulation sigma factor SigH [Eubacteriales bacterium OttesenSCG-928-N14]
MPDNLAYAQYSDEELALLAQTDADALSFLLEKYKNLVRARARSYYLIGGDREDLLQEGMVGLYKAVTAYQRDMGGFAAFADLCVTRQLISAIKAASRQKHMPLNTSLSLQLSPDGEEGTLLSMLASEDYPNPEDIVLLAEERQAMQAMITQQLSSYEKQVLGHYLSGESYEQIANTLGRTQKSIDNALSRIRKKLQKTPQ